MIIAEGILLLGVIIVIFYIMESIRREAEERREIEMLTRELEETKLVLTQLVRQNAALGLFVDDLRIPLEATKSYISLILSGGLGKLSHDLRGALTRIHDTTEMLAKLIDSRRAASSTETAFSEELGGREV